MTKHGFTTIPQNGVSNQSKAVRASDCYLESLRVMKPNFFICTAQMIKHVLPTILQNRIRKQNKAVRAFQCYLEKFDRSSERDLGSTKRTCPCFSVIFGAI
ncbi:hypothetical protein CDAR_276141 [Caerostris darwini]|uniref:Uncharacterized protein n=1 Tax=Caerostris darwini TaxID=1538125 RepID=A0AAV4QP79_9ARAC|nr:hypothetical protein CDAR_276141 [Caerostris darwini]